MLKNADFMPYIIFIAAPSAEALMVMYEEGRRKGKFRGKSGPGTVDVRTVREVYFHPFCHFLKNTVNFIFFIMFFSMFILVLQCIYSVLIQVLYRPKQSQSLDLLSFKTDLNI